MKKRLAKDLWVKARELFNEGLITAKDYESVMRLSQRAMKKL